MISILMPVYNAELYINDTLESIANQNYKNIEILICDDCSSDNSVLIVEKFIEKNKDINVRFFKNHSNMGYLKTSNFLASHATGEYISFQDADDLALPDRFNKLKKHLIENSLDLVGSYCGIFFKKNHLLSVVKYSLNHNDIIKDLSEKNHPPFCGSSIMVKSEVIKKCGLYCDDFDRIGAEDFDWIYRVALAGFKMGNFPEPLYLYRQHNQSVTRLNFQENKISLFSELIAKSLYLARINNLNYDFEYFKNKFINDSDLYSELLNYKIIKNSFLGSKKELLKNIYVFLISVKMSKNKIMTALSAGFVLIFNYTTFEKIKNILKNF